MRPLITRSNLLDAGPALPGSARARRGQAIGLPFALGAATLAVLGVPSSPAWAQAAAQSTAQGTPQSVSPIADAVPALAVDVANGPLVTILSPHYNATLKGMAQVLVGVQARKNTPSTIEMLVDGRSATQGAIALPGLPSSNFDWDTSKLADGMHRLSVVITDTQGFRGGADVNVFINNNKVPDLTPPSLEWLNVRGSDTWRGMVDLQLKALDNFGVRFLIISLNPASTPNRKPPAFSWFLNRPPYSINFDSRKAPDGLYSLRATAFDDLENEGLSPALTIAINNHTINPSWVLPVLPSQPQLPNRVLPEVHPGLGSENSEAVDPNGPIQIDPSAPVAPEAPTTAAAPSTGAPRVAAGTARSAQKPALSSARQPADGTAPAAAQAPASPWGAGHSLPNKRVAALPVVPRVLKKAAGSASMSRADMTPRDGSAVAPLPASPAAAGMASPSQRASALGASERTLRAAKAGASTSNSTRPGQSNARVAAAPARAIGGPALSAAPISGGSILAGPSAGASARGGAARELSPLAPSGLPHAQARAVPQAPARLAASSRGAASQPALGSGAPAPQERVAPQGSPAAPVFPGVDLTRRAPGSDHHSSTPPAVAMVPPMDMVKRVSQASITVAPALTSALPLLHRALAGETLASVAGRYGLPAGVLAMHNHMSEDAVLKSGQEVKLPQRLAVSMAGELVQGDVSSMMVDSVGVTPFRFLFEKQGGELQWDAANQRVTAKNSTHQVTLTIGSKSAVVNKKEVMMDLAAFLVSGRTMVPLRFFEKALNASVEWEPATGRLLVAMAE